MVDRSKVAVTGSSINGALVFKNKYMLAGKGSILPNTQRPHFDSVKVADTRLLPYRLVPKVRLTSGLEGLFIVPTSSPSILLTRAGTGGIGKKKLASQPSSVGSRDPASNHDCADIIGAELKGISIENLQGFCSRIGLKVKEMLMHVLPIGKRSLQRECNCLCSQKARRCVDNGSLKSIVSSMYVVSMRGFEVSLDRREEAENQHTVAVSINLQIFRQEPVFGGTRMKTVTRGRIAYFELFSFIDVHICSEGNQPGPIISVSIIPTFGGIPDVLQGSQASNKVPPFSR